MNKWGFIALLLGIGIAIGIVLWIKPMSGSIARGEKLYEVHCLNCHGEKGQGLGRLIPPIYGPGAMSDADLICAVRYGKKGELEVGGQLYDGVMPPNFELDEGEIRDLVNFVRKKLRKCDDCPELELVEIADALSKCTLAQPL
jgi:cytochrome c553